MYFYFLLKKIYFLLKNKILIINMSYYQCKRCSHTCKQKIEMIRHLERINKCKKDILSCNYSDQDIYDKSLIKIKYISIKNNLTNKNNDTINNNSVINTNINQNTNPNDNIINSFIIFIYQIIFY